jgi:hypothetical protein
MIQRFTRQWIAIYELINVTQSHPTEFNEVESQLEFSINKGIEEAFQTEEEKEKLKTLTEE